MPINLESTKSLDRPIQVGFLLINDFTLVTFSSAVAVMRMANRLSEKDLFRWFTYSIDGDVVSSSDRITITPYGAIDDAVKMDILFVCGGYQIEQHCNKKLYDKLRSFSRANVILGALCTGTYALAAAGLLEGYRCTTHWENISSLRERFPKLIIASSLFVIDRDRLTCSGGVSSLDLMLGIVSVVQSDPLLVHVVSEQFTLDRIRTESDKQTAPLRYMFGGSQPKLVEIISLMEANIEEPLSLMELASFVEISVRQMERLFQKHIGSGPLRYYQHLRLSRARLLLLQTNMQIVEISMSCGFYSAAYFSKCYKNQYGKSPSQERKR